MPDDALLDRLERDMDEKRVAFLADGLIDEYKNAWEYDAEEPVSL